MTNSDHADRLVGYLKAIAFYLGKARQEAETLKDEMSKKQTEEKAAERDDRWRDKNAT
jgi:hypothetical protein